MDSPIYAMLFAEELVKTFLDLHGFERQSRYSVIPHKTIVLKSRLTPQIVEAVKLQMEEKKAVIDECYKNLVEEKVMDLDDFRLEMSVSVVNFYKDGYDHVKFLETCALLVGLSIPAAMDNNFDMADVSAQILAYILNFSIYMLDFDPRRSWFDLSYAAQVVRRTIINEKEAKHKMVSSSLLEKMKDLNVN